MTHPAGILVAGPGPAGLALALQAHDHGADVRVIDRRPEAFRPSRALILHARTLEVLRPLGVTQALLARADIAPAADLHLGRRVVRVRLADLALPDTAFPHLSLIRQMDVETVLAQALADRGIEVERGTELTGVHDDPEGVRAVLRSGAGRPRPASASSPAAMARPAPCGRRPASDGPGGPTPWRSCSLTPNSTGDLAGDSAHVVAGRHGLVFVFRLGERATWRLLATRPAGADRLPFGQPGPPVPAAELQALLDRSGPGRADHPPCLVRAGPGAAPGGRPVPPGTAVPGRGRRPCLLPGHRPGDERRHPGCGEPWLEARVRRHRNRKAPRCSTPTTANAGRWPARCLG